MPGRAPRPLAGVARRAAPVSHATTAGDRAVGMKQQRGVAPAPAPRRATERESSSTRRGRPEAFSVSKSTRAVDVKREAGVARLAAPVHVAAAGERAFRKRRLDAPGEMARDTQPARRPGVNFSDQNPKRVKVACAAAVDMPVNTGPERLKKRLASEFDALRDLVKKAEALSRGNGRVLTAEPRLETPSPIVERIDARHMMSPEEGEIVVVQESGVSPVASPLVSLEKVDESEISIVPAAEQDEYIDICGGGVDTTPIVPLDVISKACSTTHSSTNSGSSSSSDSDSDDDSAGSSSSGSDESSSDSDSDSESGSDSDETVESPAPEAVPPKVNNTLGPPVQNVTSAPPPPSPEPTSETVQCTVPENDSDESVSSPAQPPVLPNKMDSPAPAEPQLPEKKVESNVPMSVLLARAKEANEIRMQKGSGWEREKTRRAVREMEKAVLPDESIHPWDLMKVGIREFEYVLEELGISLRTDV